MNRTITYEITPPFDGIKIQHYLRRKGYSRQSLIELKKQADCVRLDGVPKRFNERLFAGQTLTVHIRETESTPLRPVPLPVEIVYEDEDILVVNKSAGMPIHPSFKNTDNTLANALAWYYSRQGLPFIFRCSNRLDRDTSGLTIVSKHYVSAAILSEMGTRHEIEREYLAVAAGHIAPPEGTIDAPLGRKDSSIIERCIDPENGERAVTHYRVLACFPPTPAAKKGSCLVRLRLETGRTHQIRVHMQSIGHPLLGDYLYAPAEEGDGPAPISRQALHAFRLRFAHPITGEILTFEAPLPEDLAALLPAGPHPWDRPPGSAR